mgnify:CR=1 FL=1
MNNKKILNTDLESFLASELDINRFRDYCPNGLQVQGREQISVVITGVTASLALLEAARDAGADAVSEAFYIPAALALNEELPETVTTSV